MHAVIVGAGIAGLAAAQGLRLIGSDVDVYEQSVRLEPLGAGLSLSANALRALRALQLYDGVVAKAKPMRRLDLLDQWGKVLQTTDLQQVSRRYGHLAMAVLHRGDLHQALLSKLPEGTIRTGMKCVGAREAGDRVVLDFANGDAVEADFVLACDGIHSVVRKALFAQSHESFARYTCWRAISPGLPRGVDRAQLTETWGAGKRFGLAAIPGDRIYWFACRGAEITDDPALAGIELDDLKAIFADFHEPIPEVLGRTPPTSLIRTDILDLDPMRSFTRGKIVLLGDAAHAVTPDLGQGAGLAIEDAAVLCALMARLPIEKALREYDARRVGRARLITIKSRLYARVAQWHNPLVVPLRNFFVSNIPQHFMDRQLDAILDIAFDPIRTAA
ncbi:2-polyprenyl-6-methoxyphenol hydroxylase-like FAD-dependent oxidoreductase [Rhizobium azibense]|uniref:2-polyprenyl-6-methoxyphenol hydroxylase-like FAD-dependent oxidoreductase n=1 Tax=Rhizobium azibense TaxID=1136135 RepID=A0A4R3QQ43_9HYPH|nr:FAD-dependent monooxygenase [Rhizobium azibense]TCU23239.1 2-polyprenyl-6-methoxyphenol hydroxylase-like FAD-dependent oxidoreductase [Rhizobium azibense]